MNNKKNNTTTITISGVIIIALILIFSVFWMSNAARKANEEAVRTVSLLYLDELAGRREQVVENNLSNRIRDLRVAVEIMDAEALNDLDYFQAYQARMKKLYNLEKFAFIDTDGLIYTSLGYQNNIDDYDIDYQMISEPEISILNLNTAEKKVIIAVPVNLMFKDKKLCVCFMEIDMKEMLEGLSMESNPTDATFCNIYTRKGIALSDTILGGLAVEDNLLEALKIAEFEDGYSYDEVINDFDELRSGEASFTYKGIKETLSYVPVKGTDWLLTYLVRESVISERIGDISRGIINRSIIQSALIIVAMLVMFTYIIFENRRRAKLELETETAKAEVRGKQEELDQRIILQKQLEQQSQMLSQALDAAQEANKAKTTFLSNMSHEIRTPMNAIIGLDNIALNDGKISAQTRDYLEKIGESADHLLNLINEILDMSRIESGHMVLKNEEFSFKKLLGTINIMFSSQCHSKGLNYNCKINGDVLDYYKGDDTKLKEILINILGNAVKFTPVGGSIDLEITCKARAQNKSTLCFKIKDTGIGMSKEFLPHLYDAFSQENTSLTNKMGSTGLGMPITKSFVEMMNGEIEVESEKGKGTTFYVTITLDDGDNKQDEFEKLKVDPKKLKVLIVDDDDIACKHGSLALAKAGIESSIAHSGDEAIEMVSIAHGRSKPYNLILIDWQMPGMDGVETTRKIRSLIGNESAIIILTAYNWDDILDEALKAGVDSFISKPLFATSVIEEYKQALKRKEISESEKSEDIDLSGRRVLLAEDIDINAEIIIMLLKTKGVESELAKNGKIAVEMFENSKDGYYDAILMDVRMPEMDGLEATRIIRSLDRDYAKNIPIIALTANAFDEDVKRSLQAGLNAHISKPIQPDLLLSTLKALIFKP